MKLQMTAIGALTFLVSFIVPDMVIADDASDTKLFVGKWKGERAADVWVFEANGTFISNPGGFGQNKGTWFIKNGVMNMTFEPIKNKITWDGYKIDKDEYVRTYNFGGGSKDVYKRTK